mgnify:CR=1 FL=1|jgi:hypothetical protein
MINIAAFDWDSGNRKKCQGHGLTSLEVEEFFKQEIFIAPDFKHSQKEARYLAAGRSQKGRPMFVAFTLREKAEGLLIRPIGARYMHEKEAKRYEEESSET